MTEKPELIIFSQYLLGGGASFHRNMLQNMPTHEFELKVIYLYPQTESFTTSLEFRSRENDLIFEYEYEKEGLYKIINRLDEHISNREGVIVTSLNIELYCLEIYPKEKKTIYFICHDEGFLPLAKKFHHIIDVYIAHNFEIFEELKKLLPSRINNIYFIAHGVFPQKFIREINLVKNLKIAFLARHHLLKGIYDLPKINQLLLNSKIQVDWLIMGDGPEREKFKAQTKEIKNFSFDIPDNNEQVIKQLKSCDIFILPSRKDGLPVALLESMSVGCVPIVSNFSYGIKQVVTNDIGYVVDVGYNEKFAECITKLHKNRNLLKAMSDNSISSITINYDIREKAAQYFSLYADFNKYKTNYKKRNLFRLVLKRLYYYLFSEITLARTAIFKMGLPKSWVPKK